MDPSSGLGPSSNKDADKSVLFEAIQNIGSLDADVNSTGALVPSNEIAVDPAFAARLAAKRKSRLIRFSAIGAVIALGVAVMVIKGLTHSGQDLANARTDASQRFGNTSIPLARITGGGALSVQNGQTLSVNGQLNVNNSLVLAPTKQPSGAVTGQLYYDQTTNQLNFFNGKQFVKVVSGNLPTPAPSVSVNGATGSLTTGNGIALAGNQLSNSGVLTLQGETGNVTLTAGNGVLVNGTTLSNSGLLSLGGQNGDIAVNPSGLSVSGGTLKNTGVTSIGGQTGDISVGQGLASSGGTLKNSGIISAVGAGTITVTNDGNGNIIIDGPNGGSGGGTVASPGGTSGKIAKFTGVQTIADSLLSDNGTAVTVGGALHVTGAVTFDTPLAVTSGGTGSTTAAGARTNLGAAASGANGDITSLSGLTTALTVAQGGTGVGTLATNGVLLGNGTSPLSSVVAGASGLCLVSTAGTPAWQVCPGSGGVSSFDGLTGGLTLANSSAAGSIITINNASTGAKGIASFNATNFLVNSGAVNTVQDIAVSSTPTFAGLTLSSPLAVSSGGTGKSSLTANGVLIGNGTSGITSTTGSTGQCLVVSAGGNPTFQACPGAGGVTSINSATGAVTIQGTAGSSVSTVGGTITINDASSAVKGLASFNGTNFTVSSGAVNIVQDIATTSAPTFGQLSIVSNQAAGKMLTINNTNAAASGNLLDLQLNGISKLSVAPSGNLTTSGTITSGTINGQTISNAANFTGTVAVGGALSVNTISPTSALTVGVSGQSFTLQGNATSTLTATNGANTTTVSFQNPTANVNYRFAAAAAGNYDICTTTGNCASAGGGVTTLGGTANTLAKFTASGTIGNSIITDNGSTVTIGGTLTVNNITPTSPLTVGATSQNLTLQGAAVTLSATSGAIKNSLVFAIPSSSNKTITLPDASGTVAVSASGPLSLDASGNLTCPTCLTSGGSGGTSGVASLNGLTGAVVLQGTDSQTFSSVGSTISVHDATSAIKGVASFNATNLSVVSGNVNTVQDIAVTSTPTFAGLNLTSALTVANGGTGSTSAAGARTNLGAASRGANSDITSLSGLTTALSVVQGGTGIATTPTNGQILIGNGTGYSLNTLTAGSGVTITNTAGNITIAAPGSGTCATCANASLNNLSGVAINTSLLPGAAAGADLGSAALPFGQLFLAGTSASPATNNFKLTGAATTSRTITLPDASGTVAVSASGYLNLSANGNLTFVGPLAVTDGGTGANTAAGARTNLGAAASGANSDITSLSGLTTALSVVQGGTGAASLTANGVLVGNGTNAVTSTTGTNGQCLIIVAGTPTFAACPGGGVGSIDGQTGAVTIQGSTGSGGVVTIQDASTTQKGLSQFSSSYFSDNGSGLISIKTGGVTSVELADGTIANIDLAGGTYSAITGTGILGSGSITSGFGTITTNNTITTASTLQGGTIQNSNASFLVNTVGDTTANSLAVNSYIRAGSVEIDKNGGQQIIFKNTGGNTLAQISVPTDSDLFFGNGAGVAYSGANNQNVGIGNYSATSLTNGSNNIAIGGSSLYNSTTGSYNVAVGSSALNANVSGFRNTATGVFSLQNTTGSYNTASGMYSLLSNTTGTGNTGLGYYANVGSGALQNSTALGINSYVTQSDSLVLGCISGTNNCTASTKVGIGTTAPSYTLDVQGGSGIVGQFSGRVVGGNAVNNNEFVTLGQVNAAVGSYELTTGTDFIQNQSTTTQSADFKISGNGTAATINALSGFKYNGTAGATTTCSGGQFLQNAVIAGGIVTAGACTTVSSGATTIGALDGGTANANGATISGTTLYLQSASFTNPGIINTTTQTFTGDKTFKSTSNSATAFQIQNSNGISVLNADTINSRINIGNIGTATSQLYVSGLLPTAYTGSYGIGEQYVASTVVGNYFYGIYYSGSIGIVDISNPSSTSNRSLTSRGLLGANSIVVKGRYAYVSASNYNSAGVGALVILDISNPNNPTVAGSVVDGVNDGSGMVVSGRYAYVVSGSGGTANFMKIIDISNPAKPAIVSSLTTGTSPSDIAIQGRTAYIVDHATSGNVFQVVDIANPAAPSIVGSITAGTTSSGMYGPLSLAVNGRYAYVTNNSSTAVPAYVVDLANPAAPALVASGFGTIGTDQPNGKPVIQGQRLYVVDSTHSKIWTYDISIPASPINLGSISGPANMNENGVTIQGRYLYETAYSQSPSLEIFDLGGGYIQQLQTGGTQTGSLQVEQSANVSQDLSVAGGLNVGGSALFSGSLTSNGAVTLQNSSDSNGALQLLNSTGSLVLGASTTGNSITIGGLTTPSISSTTNAAGGSLSASTTYYYRLTALDANGGETAASTEVSKATTATNMEIVVNWNAISGATGYRLYRGTTPSAETGYITIAGGATVTYTDDGTAGLIGAGVPSVATAGAIHASSAGLLIQPASNNVASFQVKNNTGTSLFSVDTTNSGIIIGASAGSGTTLTNNGATINSTLALSNFASGGSIGTAAATVDIYTSIAIAQTTGGGQTLTLPNPTSSAVYGRVLYVSNIGTADFTLSGTPINKLGQTLKAGSSVTLIWSNTNGGASWIYAGTSGSAGGGVTTIGALDGGTANANGATISGTTLYLQSASFTNPGIINTTTQTFTGDKTFKSTSNSATAFQIQNASSKNILNVDSSTTTITLGDSTSGNYITFTAAGGLTAFGTAQHTKVIGLSAEYAGGVIDAQSDASCSSANNGSMTSGYDDTGDMGYYNWTGNAAAQCYDVVTRITLPSDFASWANNTPLSIQTYSTDTSVGFVNIAMKDTAHATVAGCSYVSATPASNNVWTTAGSACNFSGGTYTAGQVITIRIRMTADTTSNVRIGDLSLSYKSKF